MFSVFLSLILAFVIHESAHHLTALWYGYSLYWHFKGMRLVWDMPSAPYVIQRRVALAGFVAEIGACVLLIWALPVYPIVAVGHLAAYRIYAGEYDDFRWVR